MPPLSKLFHQLEPANVTQAVKVRLVRLYQLSVADDAANVYSMECVFHDAEGGRLHASIRRNFIPKFEHLLREEQLYLIKNFVLISNNLKLKTSSAAHKIIFTPRTNVVEVFDPDFPRNIFDFKMYNDISVWKNFEENLLIDVIGACGSEIGKMIFVYGHGGSGKTYVWKTLSAKLRSEGRIVLNVASSGIASLLLPGGRTAHSRFCIPFNLNEDSVCNISQGSQLAELIVKASLIIWDEAPMMHKHCFEALDRSIRYVMRTVNPDRNDFAFGGKTIVLGGDFRQILPVIPKGSRQDIVHATINSSYLWKDCVVLWLTKNMRLQGLDSNADAEKLKNYADWIAKIGDGKFNEPNDGIVEVDISPELLIHNFSDPVAAIVESVYPDRSKGLFDPTYFAERAILAPTLDVVNVINEYMISPNNMLGRTYLSSNVPCHTDVNFESLNDLHTPEFVNSICLPGLLNHTLNLKVGTPVMLLRNIDTSIGLCNGTRLIITRLGNHVIEGQIPSSEHAGMKVLIPRMSLIPSDTRIPFRFERRQFPLMVSYAMTINKSQGQSLSVVGLLVKKSVFCHGQLYVALSRVRDPSALKILICHDNTPGQSGTSTDNVVYKKVFHNV